MNTNHPSHMTSSPHLQMIDHLLHSLLSHLPDYDPSWLENSSESQPPIACFSLLSPDEQVASFNLELQLPGSVARYLAVLQPNETLSKEEHHALELAIMKHHGIFDCTGFAVSLHRSDSGFRAILLNDDGSDDIEIGDGLVIPPDP